MPSWLDNEEAGNGAVVTAIPAPGNSDRFAGARNDLTRYTRSGGSDSRNARSGVSEYVRHSLGGSSNAVRRMGSASRSTAKLLAGYSAFSSGGVNGFERYFSLEDVADKPIAEVFTSLTDKVCEDGGPIDGAIFRNAYIDALADNPEIAGKTIAEMTPEMFLNIIKTAMAKAVVGRINNDVMNKVILLPEDTERASYLLKQMDYFVEGGVSDGFVKANIDMNHLTEADTNNLVDKVYKSTFQFLEAAGDSL